MKYLPLIAALLIASCGGGPTKPAADEVTTARGITLIGLPASVSVVDSIHAQIDSLAVAARAAGMEPLPDNQFVIEIVATDSICQPANQNAPNISFTVREFVTPGTNYDGSEFDKDGTVNGEILLCVAGRYIDPEHGRERMQVTIPGILNESPVKYEGEHQTYYHRNRAKYYDTMYHYGGAGHPLF